MTLREKIAARFKCFWVGHDEYAEVVRFDNGTTISIECDRCGKRLHCFIRVKAGFAGFPYPIKSQRTVVIQVEVTP